MSQGEEGRVIMAAASVLFEGAIELQNSDGTSANVNTLFGRMSHVEEHMKDLHALLANSAPGALTERRLLAALEGEVQVLKGDLVLGLEQLEARFSASQGATARKLEALGRLLEEVASRCRPGEEFEAAPYVGLLSLHFKPCSP